MQTAVFWASKTAVCIQTAGGCQADEVSHLVDGVGDADEPPVLRAYLERWGFEIGSLFGGAGPEATDEQLLGIAPGYPVFHLVSTPRE